jgi:hypothetical protein
LTARNDIEALFRQIGGSAEHYREFALPDLVAGEPARMTPAAPELAPAQVLQTLRVGLPAHGSAAVAPPTVMAGLSELFNRLAQPHPESGPGSAAPI